MEIPPSTRQRHSFLVCTEERRCLSRLTPILLPAVPSSARDEPAVVIGGSVARVLRMSWRKFEQVAVVGSLLTHQPPLCAASSMRR
jgi:hypothetical protein